MYICIVPAQEKAKHRAKFGWPPVSDVAAVTKPRREIRWNLLGCPKLANRSQPLLNRSSPYCEVTWRRYCCLISFSDCRYVPLLRIARQRCTMVRRWRNFCVLYFKTKYKAEFRFEMKFWDIANLRVSWSLKPNKWVLKKTDTEPELFARNAPEEN